MIQVTPHLMFDGRCEEAFQFYAHVFGGELVMMLTYGKSPMAEQVPAEWRQKISHARLTLPGAALTGADVVPEQYKQPQGFYVLLDVPASEDAERVFSSLSADGVVAMPIQETFWSVRFGVVVDRFGIPWEVNCGQVAPNEHATINSGATLR